LDNKPIGRFQIIVAILICLIVFVDGLDIVAIAFAVPEIIKEWGVSKQQMAPVLSAAFFGLVGGALIAGPIADRVGRKLVIVSSVFAFGLFTALAAASSDLHTLLILRLLAGLGLGAALPNAITLMSEYAPARKRAFFVTLVYSGFTLGTTFAGFVAAWLIPAAGWRVALASAGVLPIVLSIVLCFALPESVLFCAAKGLTPGRARKLLLKVAPEAKIPSECRFTVPLQVKAGENPVKVILSSAYLATSISLWIAYFMGVLVVYCLFNWMPVMAREVGFDAGQSAIITSMFTLSGPVGSVLIGSLMDRWKAQSTLVIAFLTAAFLLWVMSLRVDSFVSLCGLSFVLGFFSHGSATGLNALSAKSYPTTAGATGVSWMQGWGRVGGIVSTFAGAAAMSLGWGLSTILAALTVPMVLAALALVSLTFVRNPAADLPVNYAAEPIRLTTLKRPPGT
jgi:AAHS family 4-hydroxybenzoate transporter-like MFS transporter